MTTIFAAILGGWEMILILAVILIIFGPKKLPEFARGLGQSIKEFKKASNDVVNEIQNAGNDDHRTPPPADITPKALANSTDPAAMSSLRDPHVTDAIKDLREPAMTAARTDSAFHEPVTEHKA
jgi:sec-independent protein translocase protein TatA